MKINIRFVKMITLKSNIYMLLQTYFSGSVLLSLVLNICIPCQNSEERYTWEWRVYTGAHLQLGVCLGLVTMRSLCRIDIFIESFSNYSRFINAFFLRWALKLAWVSSSFDSSLFSCPTSGDQLTESRLGLTEQVSLTLLWGVLEGEHSLLCDSQDLHKLLKWTLPT